MLEEIVVTSQEREKSLQTVPITIANNLTEEKYYVEKQDLHTLVGAYYCVPNLGEL